MPDLLRQPSPVDSRIVYCGDCLDQLKKLPERSIDLVYIDPPFNSNRRYEAFWGEEKEERAFDDRHASTQAYIDYMRPRCEELVRVLKKTGSLYYHCDWHASHYVKVMLDQILGENNFRSEIIWKRTFAHGNVGRNYGNVSDSIFFYTGSDNYTWNQQFQKLSVVATDKKFDRADPDGRRWQSVTLRNPSRRPNLHYPYKASNGSTYQPHPNGWSCNEERMRKYDAEGRLHFPSRSGGALRLKMYADESRGEKLQNVWTDVPPLSANAIERVGYPTQKPLTLLERIIETSSNPGDMMLDAFCGCGTAITAAEKLGRRWIGIDVSPTACRVMARRLRSECTLRLGESYWKRGRGFIVEDLPKTEELLRDMPYFEFESWAVISLSGTPNVCKVKDMGIDGRIYPKRSTKDSIAQTQLDFMDVWYPVQVKQQDRVGRPDIDSFKAAMERTRKEKGFFVAFSFSNDAKLEAHRYFTQTGKVISLITVRDILDGRLHEKLA